MPVRVEYGGCTMVVTSSDSKAIGPLIEARRTRMSMTAKALAEHAGVHRDTIAAIEAAEGRRSTRGATIGTVVTALERLEYDMGLDQAPYTTSQPFIPSARGSSRACVRTERTS